MIVLGISLWRQIILFEIFVPALVGGSCATGEVLTYVQGEWLPLQLFRRNMPIYYEFSMIFCDPRM